MDRLAAIADESREQVSRRDFTRDWRPAITAKLHNIPVMPPLLSRWTILISYSTKGTIESVSLRQHACDNQSQRGPKPHRVGMIQSVHAHDESRRDRDDADRSCDKRAVLQPRVRHCVKDSSPGSFMNTGHSADPLARRGFSRSVSSTDRKHACAAPHEREARGVGRASWRREGGRVKSAGFALSRFATAFTDIRVNP